jgi:hypothetical protein
MASRIVHVFSDVSMSNGHDGLLAIAAKEMGEFDGDDIPPGHLIVFINKAKAAAKVLASGSTLFHIRPSNRQPLEMRAIIELPKAIGVDGQLSYNRALEKALVKVVKK